MIMDGEARLVEPALELKEEFLAFARDCLSPTEDRASAAQANRNFADALTDFAAYVQNRIDYSVGRNLRPGYVPASTFWLMDGDGSIVGWVSLRHRLNENLAHRGGHIGYYIRPSARCKGYGTLICRLALCEAKKLGIERVLITCAKDNVGSNRIIQKNGGVLENDVWDEQDKELVNRYWVEL